MYFLRVPTQLLFDWSHCVNCSLERVPMLIIIIEQNRTEQNALFPIIGFISRTIRHEDVIEKGANRRLCLVLVRPSEK